MKKSSFKILSLLLALYSLLYFLVPSPVSAHFFETDNTVTGELHVEPNDNPIPGENAFLNFRFTDTAKKFTLATCTCTLSVFESLPAGKAGKKKIFETLLTPRKSTHPSIYDATFTYSFPEKALYDIVLTGQPKISGTFEPFSLTWDFRVTQSPKAKPIDFTHTLLLYFGVILGAFLILGFLFLTGILLKKSIT
ncbi:MAG TPA: hypothetical protein VEW42_04175 [Candidatus Eisenbacteria bacterium]|nr:hypothetical protein [Candidatus Eisenbacteria bacterium]